MYVMEYLQSIRKIRFSDRIEIVTRYFYHGYLFVIIAFKGKYTISIINTEKVSESENLEGNYVDYDYEELIKIAKNFINQVELLIIKQKRKLYYGGRG